MVGVRGRRAGGALAALAVAWLAVVSLAVAPADATGRPPAVAPAEVGVADVGVARSGLGRVQAAPWLRVEAHTSFTLDLAARAVHVRHDVTLTNQQPDVSVPGGVRRTYLPDLGIGVPTEAVGFIATVEGGSSLEVSTRATESQRFRLAVVDLEPDLYFPDTRQLTLAYDLPRLDPRVPGLTRVNEAFATFPVYGLGDPGLGTIEVLLPDHLEVELVGDEMERSDAGGQHRYAVADLADPAAFFTSVVARDDARLVQRVVELDDDEVEVLGWPDDPAWADFVARLVADGVPALEELIGLDWPADELQVVETVAPYLYGYAGWFTPSTSAIEVGDELDPQVILHELSHLWFNGSLFQGRWINEALAEEFSGQALVASGQDRPAPEPPEGGPEVLRLNAWGEPDLQSGDAEAQETYGYAASATLLRQVADEIGIGPIAEAVRVAAAGESPYRADEPSDAAHPADWRTLLDLLQEVGGSAVAEPLFRELVVTPEEVAALDQRAGARAAYAQLVESGAGWAPPAAVRAPMAAWRFADATALMPEVTARLADRAELASVLAQVDQPLPPPLEATYEGATDLGQLAEEMGRAELAALRLREADAARAEPVDPLERVGLLFDDLDADVADAADAMQAGDYAEAARIAAGVSDAVDGAAGTGAVRLALAAVLALIVALAVRSWPGAGSRRQMLAGAAGGEAGGVRSEADGAERVGSPTDGGGEPGV